MVTCYKCGNEYDEIYNICPVCGSPYDPIRQMVYQNNKFGFQAMPQIQKQYPALATHHDEASSAPQQNSYQQDIYPEQPDFSLTSAAPTQPPTSWIQDRQQNDYQAIRKDELPSAPQQSYQQDIYPEQPDFSLTSATSTRVSSSLIQAGQQNDYPEARQNEVPPPPPNPFVPPTPSAVVWEKPDNPNKKSKTKLIAIIVIIAVVIIGGIIAVVLITNQSNNDEYMKQLSLGEKYLSEEKYDEAIVALRRAIEINPNNPEAYLKLADAYIAKGDTQSAIQALELGLTRTNSEAIRTKLNALKNGGGTEVSGKTKKEAYKDPEYTLGKVVASGNCGKNGDNVKWEFDENGLLVISGSGKMKDYYGIDLFSGQSDAPWRDNSIKKAIIKKGVTSIGEYAFFCCDNLTSITIPDSVTSIGYIAFYGCTSLKSITIPDSVTRIGDEVFWDCTSLKSVTIPSGVTKIGLRSFRFCTSLKSITIPNSVTSIGYEAFSECTSLKSITIPSSVTSIGHYPFYKWTSSQTINIKGKSSAPSGWDSDWKYACSAKIVWNA